MALDFDEDADEGVQDILSFNWVRFLSTEARKDVIQFIINNSRMRKSELAELLDVSPTAINKFLKGQISPSDATIMNAFRILKPNQVAKLLEEVILPQLREAYDSALNDWERVLKHVKSSKS